MGKSGVAALRHCGSANEALFFFSFFQHVRRLATDRDFFFLLVWNPQAIAPIHQERTQMQAQ